MKAQRRLHLAEQMRKQAAAELVNSMMPWEMARMAGTEAADAMGHFEAGNLGKGLWSGVKSIGNAAMMVPMAGTVGKGLLLGAKAVGGIGKGISHIGKGIQGFKTMPGLSNVAGGTVNYMGGKPLQAVGHLGAKAKPLLGEYKGWEHLTKDSPATAFQKRMLGSGKLNTAVNTAAAAPLVEMGGEAAWAARPNILKPKLPEQTGTSNQHFQTAKSWLGPQGGSPVNAGHNVEFPS